MKGENGSRGEIARCDVQLKKNTEKKQYKRDSKGGKNLGRQTEEKARNCKRRDTWRVSVPIN